MISTHSKQRVFDPLIKAALLTKVASGDASIPVLRDVGATFQADYQAWALTKLSIRNFHVQSVGWSDSLQSEIIFLYGIGHSSRMFNCVSTCVYDHLNLCILLGREGDVHEVYGGTTRIGRNKVATC